MCLGVPMEVEEVRGSEAICVAKGVRRTVSLLLLPHLQLAAGDHVLVHVGHAIQKMSADEARDTWRVLDEILQIEDRELSGEPVDPPIRPLPARWGPGGGRA